MLMNTFIYFCSDALRLHFPLLLLKIVTRDFDGHFTFVVDCAAARRHRSILHWFHSGQCSPLLAS